MEVKILRDRAMLLKLLGPHRSWNEITAELEMHHSLLRDDPRRVKIEMLAAIAIERGRLELPDYGVVWDETELGGWRGRPVPLAYTDIDRIIEKIDAEEADEQRDGDSLG
jgi:hypothetical protein